MRVKLKDLKPNPMRDFQVDPIDPESIERLKNSIKEDGFWGGVVCRKVANGDIQIAAGHHRVEAAIAAGVDSADLFVRNGDMDDAKMIRVYARENATQRNAIGTAQTGSVASALRFIAKLVLGDVCPQLGTNDAAKIRGNIASDKGLGEPLITGFLQGVPGINTKTVEQAIANLKTSGNYARIIGEVSDEIERENKAAVQAAAAAERDREAAEKAKAKAEAERKAAEEAAAAAKAERDAERQRKAEERKAAAAKAAADAEEKKRKAEAEAAKHEAAVKAVEASRKAAGKAAKNGRIFDFEGVSKHVKNAHQIDAFRNIVTSKGFKEYITPDRQAELAKKLVDLAAERGVEFTGAFIRDNAVTLLLNAKQFERQLRRDEREKLLANDVEKRAKQYQHDFAGHIRSAIALAAKLIDLRKEADGKGVPFPITDEFRRTLDGTAERFVEIKKWL